MSTPQQPPHRYTNVAIILHWLIAACILFNLTVGFFMEGFSPSLRGVMVGLHISSGMSVLGLTLVRIAWRMTHMPPALPVGMPTLERQAAAAAHALLYVGMLVLPLTGWIFLSAHHPKPGMTLHVWGLLPLPQIGPIANMSRRGYQTPGSGRGERVGAHGDRAVTRV